MPQYLSQVSYTAEGARGLLKEGGTGRVAYLRKMVESRGGKLEAFYWALGETDAYIITEGKDNVNAAAISLAVSASGAMRVKTVVLLTATGSVGTSRRQPPAPRRPRRSRLQAQTTAGRPGAARVLLVASPR